MRGFKEAVLPLRNPKLKGRYQLLMLVRIMKHHIVQQPIAIQTVAGQAVPASHFDIILDGCNASGQVYKITCTPGIENYHLDFYLNYWTGEYSPDLRKLGVPSKDLLITSHDVNSTGSCGSAHLTYKPKQNSWFINHTLLRPVPSQQVDSQLKAQHIKCEWVNPA